MLTRAFRTAAVLAFAAVAALTLSERPAEAQTAQTVQPGWQYIPSGISAGQSFRLLFVTSTTTVATSTSISTYNSFVRARAAANTHLSGFSSQFRALISTQTVNARDNTATTGTGVPIYWLGGAKVADDYADFYDGSWDSRAGKTETGGSFSGGSWTGSNANGTKHSTYYAGASSVQFGTLFGTISDPISHTFIGANTANVVRLYALSPVITVQAAKPRVSLSLGSSRIDESGANNSTTLRATLSKAVSSAVTVTLSASPADKVQFSGSTLTIASGATQSGTVTVTAVDNSADAPDASVRISGSVSGADVTAPDAVTLTVTDDEADLEPLPANPPGQTGLLLATPSTNGAGAVRLWWNRIYDDTVTKFQVAWRKASDSGETWRDIEGSGAYTTGHWVTGLENGVEYVFRVRAVNRRGAGAASKELRATPTWPGDTVVAHGVRLARFGADAGDDWLKLGWRVMSGPPSCGFVIEWRESGATGNWERREHWSAGGGNFSTFTIGELKAGTGYDVRVLVQSGYTNIAPKLAWERTFTTTGTAPSGSMQQGSEPGSVEPPAALAQVTGVAVQPGFRTLDVSWTAVSGAGGYKVQWKSGSEEFHTDREGIVDGGSTTSYRIAGLHAKAHTVRVIATKEGAADGPPSQTKTGTPKVPQRTIETHRPSYSLDEGDARFYFLWLTAKPSGPVTVTPVSRDTSALTITSEPLTFTPANWNRRQPVWVRAVVDADTDSESVHIVHMGKGGGLDGELRPGVRILLTDKTAAGGPQQQPPPEAAASLTARVSKVPAEHDGSAFAVRIRFSEAVETKAKDAGVQVSGGTLTRAVRVKKRKDLWELRVRPSGHDTVTVTLPAGAARTADGRTLSDAVTVTVSGLGPVALSVADASAREGAGATMDFAVTLSRAASGKVTVKYATRNGTAKKGKDYGKTRGKLVFAAGETSKTVSVAILDDAHDEGAETFTLRLSKPKGAVIADGEAVGTIENSDPLQKDWLARFGRAAAADAVAAVTARLETPRDAGSHLTLAGQRVDLSDTDGGAALEQALTGFARLLGASPEAADPAGTAAPKRWLSDIGPADRTAGEARTIRGRELLMGSSFRAVLGGGAGAQWTSWGQGASVSAFSSSGPSLSLSGETATGSLGMDYEHGRLLTGFAMTHSLGEGTAQGAGRSYLMGSAVTTALPYVRYALSERLSAWGLAGTGTGRLTLELDGGAPERYGADLSMTLAAVGMRGDLVTPAEAGGFALALKADGFWVRTESGSVSAPGVGNLAGAEADVSRLRAVLDGSRTFALAEGATLTPSVTLGVRHDGGDAETGTGMELGAGLGYADPSRGLEMALRVHGLAAHAERGYNEWGVSGSLRLVPGGGGRGLSASLTPSYGVDPGGPERLWMLPDAHAMAPNEDAPLSQRLDAEVGYGIALFGGGFTGTPNVGMGLSDTARELRLGWRLAPADGGDFEFHLDAARRDAVGDTPEHRIGIGVSTRW